MADKKSASKKPKAIVDVAHPGTSAPSASGKPVIVTNRPMLKDPMVVEERPTEDKSAKSDSTTIKVKVMSKAAPQTAPLEDVSATESETAAPEPLTAMAEAKKVDAAADKAADDPEAETQPAAKAASSEKETAAAPPSKAAPQKPAPAEKKANTAETSPGNVDDTAGEEVPTIKSDAQQEAEAAAAAEHAATVQKLIDGRQYLLPINSVEKRKSKRFVLLGVVLSVLLALAWADIALDAGLIHVKGVKPVTHFFSN